MKLTLVVEVEDKLGLAVVIEAANEAIGALSGIGTIIEDKVTELPPIVAVTEQ